MELEIKQATNGIVVTSGVSTRVFETAASLVKWLETQFKFGEPEINVPAALPVMNTEAKWWFTLRGVTPHNKVHTIKIIREWTGLGLKEAKECTESDFKIKEYVACSLEVLNKIDRAFRENNINVNLTSHKHEVEA